MVRKRIETLDVMQALAMILVVLGHHLFHFMPDVYGKIHYYIYAFHMPLFIFISGFLISYSYNPAIGYKTYIVKKFIKFFVPYLIIGTVVTILYYYMYGVSISENIVYLILSPKQSSTTFLWYIYMLFFLYVLYPFIYRTLENGIIYILIAIALILNIFPLQTSVLCIDYMSKYGIFYLIGCFSVKYYSVFTSFSARIIAFILFILFVITSIGVFCPNRFRQIGLFIIPYLSIPSVYLISLLFQKIKWVKDILVVVSKECFHIYLFHMFVIQGIALIYHELFPSQLTVSGMILYIVLSSVIAIYISIFFFKVVNKLVKKIRYDINSNTIV